MFHSLDDLTNINQAYSQTSGNSDMEFSQNSFEYDLFESESCERLSSSYENISDIYESPTNTILADKRKQSSFLSNEIYESIMKLIYVGYTSKDIIKCIETIYVNEMPSSSRNWREILGYLPIPSQCIYYSHHEPIFSIPMVFVPYNSSPKFHPFYITLRITPFEDILPSVERNPDSSYTQMDCYEDADYEVLANQIMSLTSSIFETIPFSQLIRLDLDIEDKEKMYHDYFLTTLKSEHYQLYNIMLKMAEKYGLLLPKIDSAYDFIY